MNAARRRATLGVLAAGCLAALVLTYPVTTMQGVNYEVATHQIPLYLESTAFISRSAQYRQIADEVIAGASSEVERVTAVFEWTRRNIRPVPDGFPVIDDHILNIITRGYGTGDQQADVIATIATYAGVPSFWARVPSNRLQPGVILSFAQVDGAWRVFDLANGVAMRTAAGQLATMSDLAGHPALIPATLRDLDVDGASYSAILTHAAMPTVPRPLRAQLQMPWPRVWYEIKAAAGLEPSHEFER